MRYFLAILLPPVAVLLCGKPFQFLLSIILTLLFWVPGMIHAILVVHEYHEDRRADMIVRSMRGVPAYR
jgi:uncharacterized membrane protein YqaE (UPF0057 family)